MEIALVAAPSTRVPSSPHGPFHLLVVTPTLGRSPWLRQTVASVARMAPAGTHMLVAPKEEVARLAAEFPDAHVVPDRGGGMYAAINAGIAAAPCEWDAFTYLNDDDILLPGFAATATAVARADGQAVIAYGRVALIDARGGRIGSIPLSPAPSLNRLLYAQRLEPVYQHGTVVSRAALQRLGGFDETLRCCGDSEFLARACLAGIRFVRIGEGPVAAFRLHAGQLTKSRSVMNAERALVDERLGLLTARLTLRHRWARVVFRLANVPVYAGRLIRFGFVSFDEVLARGG